MQKQTKQKIYNELRKSLNKWEAFYMTKWIVSEITGEPFIHAYMPSKFRKGFFKK